MELLALIVLDRYCQTYLVSPLVTRRDEKRRIATPEAIGGRTNGLRTRHAVPVCVLRIKKRSRVAEKEWKVKDRTLGIDGIHELP